MDAFKSSDRVRFRSRIQRPLAYMSIWFFSILSLTNGYAVFIKGNWDVASFFTANITIGFVLVLYLGSMVYYREWRLRDIGEIEEEILPKIVLSEQEEIGYVAPTPKNWLEKIWMTIV